MLLLLEAMNFIYIYIGPLRRISLEISHFRELLYLQPVADPGEQIRPCPSIEVGNGVCPPSRDSIVKSAKCKDFGPPYRCEIRICPPPKENGRLKHEKGR